MQQFQTEDGVAKNNQWIHSAEISSFYRHGIHQLLERWQKVVEANEGHIDWGLYFIFIF